MFTSPPLSTQSMTPSYRMVFSTLRLGCFHMFTFHTSFSVLSGSPWRDSGKATPCLCLAAVLWHHGIRLHDPFKTAPFMPTQPVAHGCCCHVLLPAWKGALIPWTTPAEHLTCQNPLLGSCFRSGENLFSRILTTGAPFQINKWAILGNFLFSQKKFIPFFNKDDCFQIASSLVLNWFTCFVHSQTFFLSSLLHFLLSLPVNLDKRKKKYQPYLICLGVFF